MGSFSSSRSGNLFLPFAFFSVPVYALSQLFPSFTDGALKYFFFLIFHLNNSTLFLLQLSITVYDNSVMQVKGSTFLLWTLECFPGLSRLVDVAMSIEVSYTIIYLIYSRKAYMKYNTIFFESIPLSDLLLHSVTM